MVIVSAERPNVPRSLNIAVISFPIRGIFSISRGTKTSADVVICTISEDGFSGRGECVPYRRYGETIDSVVAEIRAIEPFLVENMDRTRLQAIMKPGAARNAVDCALWDLQAKTTGIRVAGRLGINAPAPLITAFTISLGEPEKMAAEALTQAHRALLKVKVGTTDDVSRIMAVRQAAPDCEIILDANEGWSQQNLDYHLQAAAHARIALIEQPLPVGKDEILAHIPHPVAICADESVHSTADLAALIGRYDAINIKLDKTGGLSEALVMKNEAKRLGFKIMTGCMVGSSLAMAPSVLLAQDADYADLDGPLLLSSDCADGLTYAGSLVWPPTSALWG